MTTTHGDMDISVNFDQNGRLSLIGCAAAAPPDPVSLSRAEAATKAGDVVAQLRAGNYQAVIASLDALEQTYLDAGRLQNIWESFERAQPEHRSGRATRCGPIAQSALTFRWPGPTPAATSWSTSMANYQSAPSAFSYPTCRPPRNIRGHRRALPRLRRPSPPQW